MSGSAPRARARRVLLTGAAVCVAIVLGAADTGRLWAQKDYYNLDRHRPVRIEDAAATERYAFEVKLAPLRLDREPGGGQRWSFDPGLAYGILPRTSVELGLPVASRESGESGSRTGVGGLELGAFHNLNTETRTLPALGVRATVLLPVGALAADDTYTSVTGIATRTLPWARIHVNAEYTFGASPTAAADPGAHAAATPHDASRWLAGIAVDRVFPLDAWLLVADVYAAQPLHEEEPVAWQAGAGVRYQLSPALTLDAGLGRRLTAEPAWYFTVGTAWHFGVRALMPQVRR